MHALNAVKSPPDNRDYKFIATFAPQASTDLRALVREIEDQALEGSCTANALTNGIELLTQKASQWEDLSRQFSYYVTRDLESRPGQSGTYSLRDNLEAARKFGLCLESEWDYLAGNENVRPTQAAYDSALLRKVTRYEAIDISTAITFSTDYTLGVNNIKAALAEGMPVIVSLALGSKFYDISGPLATHNYWQVDLPWLTSTGNTFIGAHALTIVGNNDAGGYWICENSWGAAWGDHGYCAIPYNVIRDFGEAWVIRGYKNLSFTDQTLYAQQQRIVRLYVAILGRPPELGGLLYWLEILTSGAAPLRAIAAELMGSLESRTRFPGNADIIVDLTDNIALFNNRMIVASYFTLDLACNRGDIAAVALNGVTDDPATVEVAKKAIRVLLGNGTL